MEILQQ